MRTPLRLAAVVLLLLALGCSSLRVNVDYDPNEDFSAYRTFTWFPREQRAQGDYRADSPLVDARIRKAVERELAARGYRKVEDRNPDFFVAFFLSVEDKIDVYTVNRGYYDYWGYGVMLPETRVSQYEEGTLVIDIADARKKQLTWRGIGQGRLRRNPTPEQVTQDVDAAVKEILARFPRGAESKGS